MLKIISAPALVVLAIFVAGVIYHGLVSNETMLEATRAYLSSWKVFLFAYLVLLVAHSIGKLVSRSKNKREND